MPVYEYKCQECGSVHQEVRRIDGMHEPSKCECGGEATFVMSRPSRFQRSMQWNARIGVSMPGEVD